MAKLLDLSVYGPGHISNILQVDASVYAKAFVTDGGKDTQVVRGDGTLASISSLSVGNAATATNAPWSGITGKPTTFTPSAHTHTASDITGLPTSLKNPYKLTFGSKTYDGSAAATITASDLGALTSITKSMVEGVLTGNITSHTHSQYLTSALRPAKLFVRKEMFPLGYFIIKINNNSEWILSFDVKIVVPDGSYTIRFSEDNSTKSEFWHSPSASMIDGEDSIEVKFGYSRTNKWVAIPAPDSLVGISITNVANGYAPIDTYDLDKLFTINFFGGDASDLEYLGTVQETITIYPPSKEGHTHTFASLTSKPTTINGYGITDALTTSNYNSYVPTRTGTGASGTWGISISGNAATATNAPWSGITGKPATFTPSAHTHTASDITGLPTSLKNPYALTFGSKTYDGSAAATITASDLGALTAHQSIYAFTLQVNGTSKGTYNPASAAKTINIAVPTKTSDITNNSGFITSASIPTALKNPYAVEIKANGVSLGTYDGSVAATFNLSAANVGAANKVHTHTASEISGLPTKLSSFTNDVGYITGITKSMVEGVLTGNITSHTHSYLPLSGGTLRSVSPPLYINRINGLSTILYQVDDVTVGILGFDQNGVLTTRPNYQSNTNYYNIIHAGNYNSYAPTLTGTGASGTWGINITGNAASANGLVNEGILDSQEKIDNFITANRFKYALFKTADSNNVGFGSNDGMILSMSWSSTPYGAQMAFDDTTDGTVKIRGKSGSWGNWYKFLHSGNYNSYSPKLDGTGASGTWGISISGNAATVGGYSITTNKNTPWGTIPYISTTGIMEVGKHFEFHYDNTTGSDYSTVLGCTGNYGNIVSLPSATGTLALLTDNVASATKLQDNTAFTAWGQTFFENGKPKNVSGHLSMEWSKIYWNGDIEGSYISSHGMTEMIYEMRAGHSFYVNRDMILRITRFGNVTIGATTDNGYKLHVNGSANATTLYENGTRVALSGHTHDDRYYTESEVDTKLSGKSDTGHTHTKSQITDFPTSMPASDVYAWAKASTKPTYTYSEVGAAAASHGTHLSGSAALYSNSSSGSNCNNVTYNLIGYYTSNGPSTSLGASTNDGSLYSQAYSSSWVSQIAQDYRNGNLFTRGKNNGTWTAWKAVSYNGHTHTKSQITDFPSSLPASDVYSWAKASTKPTYTAAEVGAAAASHTHNYAGSSSAGGAATSVVVTNSNANSTYRMVWHSGNSLYSTDNIYCNPSTDSIYASAFYETSDERLKDFENNVNVDLNLIRFIPKMYFRWKKNPNKLQIGTSAQAVKQIYPELVSSSEDGILSVDYSKLSIVALSAIDKLHLENQNLKHEINLLKQEIEKLKGQI